MPAPAASALLDVVFSEYGLSSRYSSSVDLTALPPALVLQLCGRLVASGQIVLHGSNNATRFARLEPRQANDAWKDSGNLRAVYASDEVFVVLMQALLDRGFLRRRLGSFHVGYRLIDGVALLKVSPKVHELFLAGEPALCSQGFVYVLDKRCFGQATDNTAEWYCLEPVVPWCTLKVPVTLSRVLFRISQPGVADSVLPYSPNELRRLRAYQ